MPFFRCPFIRYAFNPFRILLLLFFYILSVALGGDGTLTLTLTPSVLNPNDSGDAVIKLNDSGDAVLKLYDSDDATLNPNDPMDAVISSINPGNAVQKPSDSGDVTVNAEPVDGNNVHLVHTLSLGYYSPQIRNVVQRVVDIKTNRLECILRRSGDVPIRRSYLDN
jgi:hypothetical protein